MKNILCIVVLGLCLCGTCNAATKTLAETNFIRYVNPLDN